MSIKQIADEVEKLPIDEKLKLLKFITKKIFVESEQSEQMRRAAMALKDLYESDAELTAFTSLDREPFYEAR